MFETTTPAAPLVANSLSSGLEYGMFGALATTIAMFWNQARGAFARVSSLILVSVRLEGSVAESVGYYAWKHFKATKFAEKRYSSYEFFVKPKNRFGHVAVEFIGKAHTFFDGWKPLFVSAVSDKQNESYNNHNITISFIRGTFDIEKLIIAAVEEHDNKGREKMSTKRDRYRVQRIFGKGFAFSSSKNEKSEKASYDQAPGGQTPDNAPNYRMLSYREEDIGHPVPAKPFSHLAYDPHVRDFKQEILNWKALEEWHKEKILPWRMGAGLFGPPGTGKTSFVRATGQELDMPIFIFDLPSMNNEEVVEAWHKSLNNVPCIVLFEDIDRIFDKDKNIKSSRFTQGVTLDCLLNCVNGVEPADGILVFMTANDPTKLDPALGIFDKDGKSTRPGRLDTAVYFGPLSLKGRWQVAERILSDCPDKIRETVDAGKGDTGAQFEHRCGEIAKLKKMGGFKVFTMDNEEADAAQESV